MENFSHDHSNMHHFSPGFAPPGFARDSDDSQNGLFPADLSHSASYSREMNFEAPVHSVHQGERSPLGPQTQHHSPFLNQSYPYESHNEPNERPNPLRAPLRNFESMFPTNDKKPETSKAISAFDENSSEQDLNKEKVPTKDHSLNNEENERSPKEAREPRQKEKVNIFELDDPNKSRFPKIEAFLARTSINIFLLIITLWALFADDIRLLIFPKVTDIMFDVITISVIVFFLMDIALNAIATRGYLVSLFFILDLISTFSMILDITLLNEKLFYDNG